MTSQSIPPMVRSAERRALDHSFELSSDPAVGELLATLAAAVPPNGNILELGTGVGVGLAWIVHGLGGRSDVTVLTVDTDQALVDATRDAGWPAWVEFVVADGETVARDRGPFDLIFADAAGGKIRGLDTTVSALEERGVLLVDDMNPDLHREDGLLEVLTQVGDTLLADPTLVATELPYSTHMILATKRSTLFDG